MTRKGTEVLREALRKGAKPEVWVRFPRQLGDVVFALPFFHALKREWEPVAEAEGVKLRWVAVGHIIGAALFQEAHPDYISRTVIEAGGQGKPDPWGLLKEWRGNPPAAVLNLSQSVRLALAAWMSRVPIRAGIADNRLSLLYHYDFPYRDETVHMALRYHPLLMDLTGRGNLRWEPLTPEMIGGRKGEAKLREAGWDGAKPYVTLSFGTRGYGKRWFEEEEKWPELARILMADGFGVAWLGGPDERELGQRLADLAPGSWNLAGRTTIPEACAIQSRAYGNVAIDTGLAHTAAATGRPTVTIIGHSPEPQISPQGPLAVVVRGASIEVDRDVESMNIYGASSDKVPPQRVANILHAMAAEAAGTPVSPLVR